MIAGHRHNHEGIPSSSGHQCARSRVVAPQRLKKPGLGPSGKAPGGEVFFRQLSSRVRGDPVEEPRGDGLTLDQEVEAGIDDNITNQLNPTAIEVEPPASQWGTALQPQEEAGGFRDEVIPGCAAAEVEA